MEQERSPKRRRAGDGTASDETIAQTISAITAQRHNRWMQDWAPPPPNAAVTLTSPHPATASSRPAINAIGKERRTACMASPIGTYDEGEREGHAHLPRHGPSTVMQHPYREGTTRRTESRVNPNVVHYESPANHHIRTSSLSKPAHAESMSPSTSIRPGLPSPALSEENTSSPVPYVGVMPSLARESGHSARSSAASGHAHTHHPPPVPLAPPPPQQQQQIQARQAPQPQVTPLQSNATPNPHTSWAYSTSHSASGVMANPRAMSSSHIPSSSRSAPNAKANTRRIASQQYSPMPTVTPSIQAQGTIFTQMGMRQRLQSLDPRIQLRAVDSGRMMLLQEAVSQGDIFYVVLSQIHALRSTPHLMPAVAQVLNTKSFTNLDNLLCTNEMVTKSVLAFLAAFPAPIQEIYSSPQGAGFYEQHLKAVVQFLWHLPTNWERLVQDSQSRLAPPIVQDLYYNLQLTSPVFQTTVFRAIARFIVDKGSFIMPEVGIEKLEMLHAMDQKLFYQGYRRSPQEVAIAYQALFQLRKAWQEYEKVTVAWNQTQNCLPEAQRQPHPHAFSMPAKVLAVFQLPAQAQAANNMYVRMLPQQQQQQQQTTSSSNSALAAMQRGRASGATMSPAQASQHRQLAPSQQHQVSFVDPKQRTGPTLIFPADGEMPRAQPTNPDFTRSALHQAHLRSPTFATAAAPSIDARLYRYVADFALSPVKLNKSLPVQTYPFHITQQAFDRMPKCELSYNGEPPTRSITEASQMYRLRCAACPPTGFPSESSWVIADNYWPENLYLECNDVILEPRRKLHHGRYLPIDLTPHIKLGENQIRAIINRTSGDTRPFEFAISVEIVGVMNQLSLTDRLGMISAEYSLISIKTSLLADNADDEISVTSSNTTIQLFDPYSGSKMFDIPVRGASCMHRDCFDLETFLAFCKREHPSWPTVVDCWRCPLCRGDVRPQTLIVDGFLIEVRRQLEKMGRLDTRAIVVEADGSWKAKMEERTGVRSPSLEREEMGDAPAVAAVASKASEVIEID